MNKPRKYVKRPIEIEAMQWTGFNASKVIDWAAGDIELDFDPIRRDVALKIKTLEGVMYASKDDFIIKGLKGEFYACKPDIFYGTYEEANSVTLFKETWREDQDEANSVS